jgi:subtilisin family serine protease
MWRFVAIASAWIAAVDPAAAQLHLPQVPLQVPQAPLQAPRVPSAPDLTAAPGTVVRGAQSVLDPANLLDVRRLAVRDRLQQHRDVLESDPAGELIVRNEVIVVTPSAAALDAARAAGFTASAEANRIVVLRAPRGLATAEALNRLRSLDPQGQYDFNHVYLPAGGAAAESSGSQRTPAAQAQAQVLAEERRPKVGLIDGGVDLRHPALRAAHVRASGCKAGPVPSVHGTAIASLLVGKARGFGGAAQGATLYAADVYCNSATGGTASMIVEALAWMAREQVPVINISLVGPANRVLEAALRTLIARGHVIVAAVGNDGPASPPLYPAAYPDVVGVTAVDVRKQVLPEAVRGPQVVFSAPGADMAVAASGESGFSKARGTSFAAPLVAGLLAIAYEPAGGLQASASLRAIDALVRDAVDLGAPGRDPVYGHGLVGERLRVDPVALR